MEPSRTPLKFLLSTFYATGHVIPMQAVAQELVSRGHQVVWLTNPDQEARVVASGATLVPTEALAVIDMAHQAAPPSQALVDSVKSLVVGRLKAQVTDMRRAIALTGRPDCLVNDVFNHGANTLYQQGEIDHFVSLGVIPMYLPQHQVCAPQAEIFTKPNFMMSIFNNDRVYLGLPPWDMSDVSTYSPELHIQASCSSLEWGEKPPKTQFVGPLVFKTTGVKLPGWWTDVENAACVVLITQGTVAVDPTSLVIPAIEALLDDDNLFLVVLTPHLDKVYDAMPRLSEKRNVRVAEWVPYDALLPLCSILITNGGYGSVTQALAKGVPLICAGTTEDKRDTAARVTHVGAGIDLATDRPSREQIRDAVQQILKDDTFRRNASRVAMELNSLGGAEKVADLMEDLVRGGMDKDLVSHLAYHSKSLTGNGAGKHSSRTDATVNRGQVTTSVPRFSTDHNHHVQVQNDL